jgi:hypothetical protein
MITWLELGIIDGVSVCLVSINVWRLATDTMNITCNFLYCNHQVHTDFLITPYEHDVTLPHVSAFCGLPQGAIQQNTTIAIYVTDKQW